jgi:PAS domain S-box-containing protein
MSDHAREAAQSNLHQHTILIVDDNPDNLAVLSDHLEAHDFRILAAQDGAKALERAARVRPDLILLDVIMPGIDGFETCRRLKSDAATQDIPIIFMTVLGGTEDKLKAFELGAVDYITKPVMHQEVLARITTHLRIQSLTRQLEQTRDELATQVEERTTELVQANRRLHSEIAERKLAEETARRSEEHLQTVLDTVQAGILIIDIETHTILDANPAALQMIGAPKEKVIGAVCHRFICLAEQGHCPVTDLGLVVDNSERVLLTANGEARAILKTAAPVELGGRRCLIESFVDIAERKWAEEALRESEERYRALYEDNPSMYFTVDADGIVLSVNKFGAQQLGYTVEELVGQSVLQVFHPDDKAAVRDQFAACIQSAGEAANWEFRKVRQDGSVLWVEERARAVRRADGSVVVLIVCDDITERKRAETELRRRADELAVITRISREVTSVPDLSQTLESIAYRAAELCRADASGVFAYRSDGQLYVEASCGVSGQFVDVLNAQGVSSGSSAIGRAVAARHPIQIYDTAVEPDYPYSQLAASEDIHAVLAVPMLRADEVIGGIVLWHRQPRRFAPDEVAFLQALAQQCVNAVENARLFEETKRLYQAEQQQRQRAEKLREAALALTTSLDRDEVVEHVLAQLQEVVPFDSASVQLLQGNRLEVVAGRGFNNLPELLGLSFLIGADNPNSKVARTRAPVILEDAWASFEIFRREPYASAHIRGWLGAPMLVGEQLIGMITLDKREPGFYSQEHARLVQAFAAQAAIAIENARLYASRAALIAELEAKNAELERFTYTVSHDLKVPLITIRGFLGFLEQDALAGNIAQVKADMARILSAADKMQQLLDELLELSRIGRLMNPPEEIPLGELAREAVSLAAGRLAGRSVEVNIASDLPIVHGDRPRLRQVLQNLVDNAIKYMGSQPHPCVEIGARRDGEETVFFVRDNGIGIEPRYHDQVFELFAKLDHRSEGTGMGLAIIKRIVEVHGGRIWIESEGAGKGSTFCFTLPDNRTSTHRER